MTLRSLLSTIFLLLPALAVPALAQMPSYDDVMLIVNDRSWSSKEIGNYFATRRGIPQKNIVHIDVDTTESIDSALFVPLKWQIEAAMRAADLVDNVNYIVTTKGCPLRVRTQVWDRFDTLGRLVSLGGQASFEDCLALMNGIDSIRILTIKTNFPISRYFGSTQRFKRHPLVLPMYLVTRLDAYTVEQVKSYIRRAENPVALGEGQWILDLDPGKEGNPGYKIGNDWLRGANTKLRAKGVTVVFDTTDTYLHDQTGVIGYGSWGSNDGHSDGGEAAKPRNTWLDGSIAETFVSTSGRSFMPGAPYGQSLIADWIAEGVCGIKGYTDEPYLSAIAHPDIVFDRYSSGFNMAESFYAGSQLTAWRQVVIGDPKMTLGSMARISESAIAFGNTFRYSTARDTISVVNRLSVPLTITALQAEGAQTPLVFGAEPLGGGPLPTIAPGDSVRVVVTFRPVVYGPRQGTLSVRYRKEGGGNDVASMIDLEGTGVRPVLDYPRTIDLGGTQSGNTIERRFTVTNATLTDTITVNALSLTGATSSFSVLSPTSFPFKLPGGESFEIVVAFTPSGASLDSASIRLSTTAEGTNHWIGLRGTTGISEISDVLPPHIFSMSVSPNPFSAGAVVHYSVPDSGHVSIELIDFIGRRVATIAEHSMSVGGRWTEIDTRGLAPGAYFMRLSLIDEKGVTRQMLRTVVCAK